MVKHGNTAAASLTAFPISSSRHAPLSLTKTMQTCSELTPTAAERCSSQTCNESVTPAKCAPLELLLSNCSMWPQDRTIAFSVSLWLLVGSEMELTAPSLGRHSLSSLSTNDLELSPAGAVKLSACS